LSYGTCDWTYTDKKCKLHTKTGKFLVVERVIGRTLLKRMLIAHKNRMGLKYRVCERTYDDKSNSACTQDGGTVWIIWTNWRHKVFTY